MNTEEDNIEKSRLPWLTNFLRKFLIFKKAAQEWQPETAHQTFNMLGRHLKKKKKKKAEHLLHCSARPFPCKSEDNTTSTSHYAAQNHSFFVRKYKRRGGGVVKRGLTSNPAHHNVPQWWRQQKQQRSNVPAALKVNPRHLRVVSVSPATLEDLTVTRARLNLISAYVHVWDWALVLHNSDASHLVFRALCRDACWSPHT